MIILAKCATTNLDIIVYAIGAILGIFMVECCYRYFDSKYQLPDNHIRCTKYEINKTGDNVHTELANWILDERKH